MTSNANVGLTYGCYLVYYCILIQTCLNVEKVSTVVPEAKVSLPWRLVCDHGVLKFHLYLTVRRRCCCRCRRCFVFTFSSSSPARPISSKLVTKHLWVIGIQGGLNEGQRPFPSKIAKIIYRHVNTCSFFFRTTGPTSRIINWVMGIQVCSNEGPHPFQAL